MSIRKLALCLTSAAALILSAAAIPSGALQQPGGRAGEEGAQQEEAQQPSEERVRELMKLTGQAEIGAQVMDAMLESFRGMPQLPPGFIDEFKKAARPAELVDLVVPIMQRNLDTKTLEAAIDYAKSPEGRKWFAAQPKITKECQEAGSQWGQKLAMEVMARLQDR